jgi:hypothetical protein
MKKILLLLSVLSFLVLISCSKSDPAPSGSNGNEFKFVSLVPKDTVIQVNGITTITATATGSGLTYKWTASYGTFVGSGSTVQWTVCHSDKFRITCEVKDNNGNTDSKEIYIDAR